LEMIADRQALQDVMLNYAAAVDERDIERYRACFAEDVEVVGFGESVVKGRDVWTEHVWGELEKYPFTQHLLAPMFAEVEGDIAQTRSDVQAMHGLPKTEQGGPERFLLWATYCTTMHKINGEWKIQRHELQIRGTAMQ
ncbi:MAG: nuclear transport factor 2 family protein, partial [Pseudomonadales bacterium]